jgi:hypothetical protein
VNPRAHRLRFAATVAVAVAGLLAAGSGCIAHRSAAFTAPPEPFGDLSDQIVTDLVADGDRAWNARQDPKQLDEAARAYGAALRYRPSDANILVRLARVALKRAGLGAAVTSRYDEATGYAERALAARNPKLLEAARVGKNPEQIFSHAEPADAPALTVYAEALLGWAIANGTATLLHQRPWIVAAAMRALGFDRAIGWAAPDRVLGILDCEMPEARQNLRDALERFEAAVAAAPAYLPTRIAYAEEYATRVRDAALYRRLLDEVVAADPKALPEAEPENLDAQKAARALIRSPR